MAVELWGGFMNIQELKLEKQKVKAFLDYLEQFINYEGSESANVLIELLGKSAKLLKNYENLLSGLIYNNKM